MVDLSKFSKDDLKKTASEINAYLKKADETDFDPNQTTPDAAHLEEKLGSGATVSQEKETGTKKSAEPIKKDDFPPGNGENGDMNGEGMTEPSVADICQQILTILQEIRGKMQPAAPVAPAPTDQVQMSAVPTTPTPTPATQTGTPTSTTTPEKRGDININVTKGMIEDVLKGMGITPSPTTGKPRTETGHPIGKGDGGLTYAKLAKMTWSETHDANDERMKSREFY